MFICLCFCCIREKEKGSSFLFLQNTIWRNPCSFCILTGYQKERMSTIFLNILLSWWWLESKKNIKLFYFFVIVCFNSPDNGFYSHSYFSFCFRETHKCSMNCVAVMLNHTFKFYATKSTVTKTESSKNLLIFCKLHLITHSAEVMPTALGIRKISCSVEFCSSYKFQSAWLGTMPDQRNHCPLLLCF